MPKITIPLILPATSRGWVASIGTSAKDQQLINGLHQVSENSLAGSKIVYLQKRGGSTTSSTIGSSVIALKCYATGFTTLSSTGAALYHGTTNIGTLTGQVYDLTNYLIADSVVGALTVIAFVTGDGSGWFCYSDAETTNFPTFTGDRTSGSAIIENIASTTGIYPGQAISGTGIPAATRVLTVDSATEITMTANATSGAATSTTITKEALSKIIDAQFPADALSMVAMDGYFFAGSSSLGVCQSAINDPSSWAAANRVKPDFAGDSLSLIYRTGNYIAVAGNKYSIQHYYNNGNSSGVVLSAAENLNILGLQVISSPVPFGDGMYLTAQPGGPNTATGPAALYRLTGVNSYQKVSDDFWTSVISDNTFYIISSIETDNKSLVACHDNGGSATFPVYDPSKGFSIYGLDAAVTSGHGGFFTKSGASTLFSWASGNTWTDSSAAYTLTAQTQPHTLNKGSPFIIRWVDLIADTEASGTATLYVSRDDYGSWESVGTFDMTAQRKRIYALGWFQGNVAFKIEHSANTNFRAQALLVEVENCG